MGFSPLQIWSLKLRLSQLSVLRCGAALSTSRGRRRWHAPCSVVLLLLVCLLPNLAWAQGVLVDCTLATGVDAGAATLKAAGDRAMEQKSFARALHCYQESYRRSPDVRLLYNQARALEFLGRAVDAYRLLRRFDRSASLELRARIPTLPVMLSKLRGQVALASVRVNIDGAEVAVAGTRVGTTPLSEPLVIAPSTVQLQVSKSGFALFERQLELTPGQELLLEVTLEAAAPEALPPAAPSNSSAVVAPSASSSPGGAPTAGLAVPSTPSPLSVPSNAIPADVAGPSDTMRTWAWISIGVGAAATATAVVSYAVAAGARDDVCGGADSCDEDSADLGAQDRLNSWKDVYTVSLVTAGVTLAAGGLLLWQSADAGPETHSTLELRAGLNRLSVGGRF